MNPIIVAALAISLTTTSTSPPYSQDMCQRYRRAAITWRSSYDGSVEKVQDCNRDLAVERGEHLEVNGKLESCAKELATHTPTWVWPTIAAVAVVLFGGGVLIGKKL